MPRKRRTAAHQPASDRGKGLFRTLLAGPGQSLNDAFDRLEHASQISHVAHHRGRNLFGARVDLHEDEGEGYWEFTRIRDDIFVVVGRFAYKDPRLERLAGDGMLQFCFNLSGDLKLQLSRAQLLHLAQPSLLIYHHPHELEITEWTEPSAAERVVAVNIRPQALLELVGERPEDLPPALHDLVVSGAADDIPFVRLPLTAGMFEAASRIIDNPFHGALRLVHCEALATELLCLAVGNIGRLSGEPSEQYTEREIRCLHTARTLVMTQLSRPPTIRQVARASGINETTLKRGFKALFGETVFEFSVRCRMQHALKLFREQRLSVAQVGEAVGYRHQTSFATAFRRHFGLRPKDVRRARRL